MSGKSVLVSHSGKQYVHRSIQALLINKITVFFCTPIWFERMPTWLKFLPSALQKRLRSDIAKRLFSFEGNLTLITAFQIALRKELYDFLISRDCSAQLKLEKRQDIFAAKNIMRYKPTIVLGYEISSKTTFETARSENIVTVLDLAQIHYKDIVEIATRFSDMHYILENPHLDEINARKQAEYDSADFIITLSSFARQTLLNRGIPNDKIYVINLGFDSKLFQPKSKYRKSSQLRLLICGTDMVRKGLGLLIQALKNLEQRNCDVHLTIVGPTHEVDKVFLKYGRPESISVLGFLTHEEMVWQYQDADLFVFPSYLDSWAMTVLEAMACGTPVIVTENTGSKDVVQRGGGVIIPAGDACVLEEVIERFYDDRAILETLGSNAIKAVNEYTWQNYYSRLGWIINDISMKSGISNLSDPI